MSCELCGEGGEIQNATGASPETKFDRRSGEAKGSQLYPRLDRIEEMKMQCTV